MQEIVIGKTRIELNDLVKGREALASLVGDKCDESITLARISNKFCQANIRFNNRCKTQSFYPNGSLALIDYSDHKDALFDVVSEFNRVQDMVYQKTQDQLEQRGISCTADSSGVQLFNDTNLFGTGTIYYCIGNEYRWPKPEETSDFVDLLCFEIALCALTTGLLYDMTNLVVMDNITSVGDVMYDQFCSFLKPEVSAAREKFKDDELSEDLQSSVHKAAQLMREADATLMNRLNTITGQNRYFSG